MGDVLGVAEVANALSQPLCKLIEAVCAGCGKLYEPIHVRRMAKAKAEELRVIAEAVYKNGDIPIGHQEGIVLIDSQDVQSLAQRAAGRVKYQELTKQINIESIVRDAAVELQQEENVPDTPVDNDWMMRFFDYASGVSDEDVQKTWARVLAGEIKQPGSFSLRTVDVLRFLSKRDAVLFQKVNEMAILSSRGPILYSDGNILQSNGIDVYDIISLADAGLLSAESLVQSIYIEDDKKVSLHNEKYVCLIKGNSACKNSTIKYGFYSFSRAGRELRCILDFNSSLESFLQIVRDVKHKNSGFSYSVHEVSSQFENTWNYNPYDLLKD